MSFKKKSLIISFATKAIKVKRFLILATVILATAVVSIVLFDYFTGEEKYSKSVIQDRLNSTILNEEREVIIYLPRNYDSTKKYPVMYVLDGSSQAGQIANKYSVLSAIGYIPETIIAGLPNTSEKGRERDYTPPFMRTDNDDIKSPWGEGDKFLAFMEKELFSFMKKNYSVSSDCYIAGNSRGGLLVMYSLLSKPDLFQARFCFSSPFWRQNNILISKASDFFNVKDTLPGFLFMSAGAAETDNIKSGLKNMTALLVEKAPKGLIWHSELTRTADHQNNAQISASIAIGKLGEYLRRNNQNDTIALDKQENADKE